MIKMLLALALAFVLAVVGTCLAAFWLAGRIPKDYTPPPYEPLHPYDLPRTRNGVQVCHGRTFFVN